MPSLTLSAEELLKLAEDNPAECVERCLEIVAAGGGDEAVADAHRASGVAYRSLGQIDRSIEALEMAERLYRESGLVEAADEARISRAPSVAISGEFGIAVELLEPLSESENTVVRSHAQTQLAGLVARTGEFGRALELYADALPSLKARQDNRWLALLYSTRGLVQTYRGEFGEAERDIRAAMTLFEILERESSVAEMLGNLGFMYVLSGEIAKGLATLVDAEQRFQVAGLPSEAIGTARAYGYMLAGLPDRAYEVLVRVADSLRRQGRQLEEGEARILAARAALEAGDPAHAVESIDAAVNLESMADRAGWQALAGLVRAHATVEQGIASTAQLRDLADELADIDNISGSADARALAATWALADGDLELATALITAAGPAQRDELELPVAVRVGLAIARTRLAAGEKERALSVLRDAADMIDRNRMLLSATESRAGLSRHSDRVAELGLTIIEDTVESIEWVERFRGSSLRIAPVVPNRNEGVAGLLSELRRSVKARDDALTAGESPSEATAGIRAIESKIRDRVIADPDISAYRSPPRVSDIQSVLGADQMLYFFQRGPELMAARIQAGEVNLAVVGDMKRVTMIGHHLLSSMRRAYMYPARADPGRTHQMLEELAGYCFGVASESAASIVVVPPPDLLALPWNAMAAKRDEETSLVVAPSAAAWMTARRIEQKGVFPGVVAGPRLAQSRSEASTVLDVHGDVTSVLDGEAATVDAALELIQSSSIFHAVAHGHLRKDNPMFSALELADGELSLYHLERLTRSAPIVVLSACDSAHGSVVAGQEMFGLTSVFLERGTRSIISTVAPIPDSTESIDAVRTIHIGLRDGVDAPTALRRALDDSQTDTVDPALAFVAYGAA